MTHRSRSGSGEGHDMANPLEHRTTKTVTKGTHYPLGATLTADGVNFAVYSQQATDVFLLLFGKADGDATDVIRLPERDRFIWHAHVKGVKAGQLYGYKDRGEYREVPQPRQPAARLRSSARRR